MVKETNLELLWAFKSDRCPKCVKIANEKKLLEAIWMADIHKVRHIIMGGRLLCTKLTTTKNENDKPNKVGD